MAAEGKSDSAQLKKDVLQYVDTHPGEIKNAQNKVLNGLSKMFSHSRKGQKVPTTPAPVEHNLPAVDDASMASHAVPVAVEEPDFDRRWFDNPWIIAGVATLTAAVCTGVAVGVLCFARVQRIQIAREPLLAAGPMQSSSSDATMAEGEAAA